MRRTPILAVAFILALLPACRKKQVVQQPVAPKVENAVVLLRDDNGPVGRVTFRNAGGSTELTKENTMTAIIAADVAPGAPAPLSAEEITRRFGSALEGLPAPQLEFILNFELGTEKLTAESEARLIELIQAVRERRSTDVSIIGHTDTTDSAESNFRLGLRRAEKVAEILRSRGLAREFMTVESRGEGDPLIRTAENMREPRNRRVEVTVR
ncbi:MAG: OmpA family protein [Bryobacterales bacterium]|nr:OmpA family protein [Bryobacterales bacterium]